MNWPGAGTNFNVYICFWTRAPGGRDARKPTVGNGMGSLYAGLVKLAIQRPWLIPVMLRTAWAFRANRWYRRPPFLPLPSKAYMKWRMETAYGVGITVFTLEELERYLRWGSDMRRSAKESVKW